jgi:hypothetical protein
MGMSSTTALDGFERFDTADESTITCPCGASFTWTGHDERLRQWKTEHAPHVTKTKYALYCENEERERDAWKDKVRDTARENVAVAAARLRDTLTALVDGLRDKSVPIGEITNTEDGYYIIPNLKGEMRVMTKALEHLETALDPDL